MGGENVRDAGLWICDEDEAWNLIPLFTYTNTHLYKVRKALGFGLNGSSSRSRR
jgi:hypothetical protein